ncbi:MAG: ABC transporter ATP-binding protein [Anaerolineales bacterium]|nr:ABC transporter ATP-binding protein [Anaerolineales bacterium]
MNDRDIVIRTYDLTKRYKKVMAVQDLNLQVYRGEVFGFLGPNGAGKTTTISMLLGLIRPTAGSAEVLNFDIGRDPTHALRRVGALVEAAFYPYLTARDNLWVMAQMSNCQVSKEHIDRVLDLVGLLKRADDKFKTFSTGMKQRLGLGAALIHDPDVLILDEPTNGLDPAGMLEIRHLIRRLSREQGKTVFLSSHLLNEVEQVCDRVLILHQGRTLATGRVDQILDQDRHIEIRISDTRQAMDVLQKLDWVEKVWLHEETVCIQAPSERASELTAALAGQNLFLHGLKLADRSLESYFLTITGNSTNDQNDIG